MGTVTAIKWRDKVRWGRIPDYMHEGLTNYIERGIRPGDFLFSVVTNDLRNAARHADDVNKHLLFDYVSFFYSFAPTGCWGNFDRVMNWIKNGGLDGIETLARQEQEDGTNAQLDRRRDAEAQGVDLHSKVNGQ